MAADFADLGNVVILTSGCNSKSMRTVLLAEAVENPLIRRAAVLRGSSVVAHTVVSPCGVSPVADAAVVAFRCASLGLVCNDVTRLQLDRCAPSLLTQSLSLSVIHTYRCAVSCSPSLRNILPHLVDGTGTFLRFAGVGYA